MPALLFGGLVWAHRWLCDDGFIYLRVADNLLSGFGPVFNPGERVEATTSPLWLLLITAAGAVAKSAVRGGQPPFEWIAVTLGVAASILAYAFASIGATRLWRLEGYTVPVGGLVVLGLVPFWDFGTSGLESSLVVFWLGLCSAAMVWVRDKVERPRGFLAAVCVGLGPLVRPDLAIFTLAWGVVLLGMLPNWRGRFAALASGLALPVAYQVFRMGYFASLVPNPAIAKEASAVGWARGGLYFLDFAIPYQILIPLVCLGLGLGAAAVSLGQPRAIDRVSAWLVAAPIAGAILHATYITRVGGDFLHARLLLPAMFAVTLPLFAIELRSARWLGPALLAWALGCLLFARVQPDPEGIGVERGREDYVALTGNAHPVTVADHRGMHWESATDLLRELGEHAPGSAWFFSSASAPPFQPADLRAWVSRSVEGVAYQTAIGLFGYEARQRIYVCDGYGLADPFGARTRLASIDGSTGRGKVGHEKWLPQDWCLAHLVETLNGRTRYSPAVSDLTHALACGERGVLYAAVDEPLGWRRFWGNLWLSARLTRLRVPADPAEARREFCGAGS